MTERVARLRDEIDRHGLAGAVATPGVNYTYLTGHPAWRTERLTCLGVPRDGTPWIVCPAFERGYISTRVPWADVTGWDETEDPFALAASLIGKRDGTWALEPTTAYHDATRLSAASGVTWIDGAPLFEKLRRAKEPGEVRALHRSIAIAWEAFDEVIDTLDPSDTEVVIADRFREAFRRRGADGWSLVQIGANTAEPHADPGDRELGAAGPVLVDWGGWIDGFTADLTRSFWWDGDIVPIEDAPEPYRGIHTLVREAQGRALEALEPGAVAGEVDEIARSVIRDAGHGERFTHRLGHGLGREIHEPPYLVTGSMTVLEVGDVVTVEPGVYLPGEFGVRWEDDVLITDGGCEILSRTGERYAGVPL